MVEIEVRQGDITQVEVDAVVAIPQEKMKK